MKLTKYEHACMLLEKDNAQLIIDPGVLSPSVPISKTVLAVIITHQHPDHIHPETVQKFIDANPEVKIFSTQDVADTYTDLPIHIVNPSDIQQVGPFKIDFFGGDHAVIHPSTPVVQNVGVSVNETFFYPGDSFVLPHRDITLLAAPAAAPWLKIQEAMDYITAVKPKRVIPAHDAVLSSPGQSFHDMWIKKATEEVDGTYSRLKTGESTTI